MNGVQAKKLQLSPSLSLQTLDHLDHDDLVLWIASDERPLKAAAGYVDWRCNGWLSRLVTSGQFRCERGEQLLTLSQGRLRAKRVFLVGLGEQKSFHSRGAEEIGALSAKMLVSAAASDIALGLPGTGDADAHAELLQTVLRTLQQEPRSAKMTAWGPWRKM